MHRYSYIFFFSLLSLLLLLGFQTLFLQTQKGLHVKKKRAFVEVVKLPDLALANGANFIRHRSLSNTFSLFSNGPELLEFFPSTYTYKYAPSIRKNPSKIDYVP